jgi:hypothetical protein
LGEKAQSASQDKGGLLRSDEGADGGVIGSGLGWGRRGVCGGGGEESVGVRMSAEEKQEDPGSCDAHEGTKGGKQATGGIPVVVGGAGSTDVDGCA